MNCSAAIFEALPTEGPWFLCGVGGGGVQVLVRGKKKPAVRSSESVNVSR